MRSIYLNNQLFGQINNSGTITDINGSKVGYYAGDKILNYSGVLVGQVDNGYVVDTNGDKIGWIK